MPMQTSTTKTGEAPAARLRTVPQLLEERPAFRSEGTNPERWLRRLIYERRLAYHKVGGKVMVDLADADAFLEGDYIASAG